jgi:hypothetical protein
MRRITACRLLATAGTLLAILALALFVLGFGGTTRLFVLSVLGCVLVGAGSIGR